MKPGKKLLPVKSLHYIQSSWELPWRPRYHPPEELVWRDSRMKIEILKNEVDEMILGPEEGENDA